MLLTIASGVFLFGGLWLAYTYAVYPLGVAILARRRAAPDWQTSLPRVALVVSAFNEAAVIEEKVLNLLSLTYPVSRLQVLVSSDGSTDETVAIAREAAGGHPHIKVIDHRTNVGKTGALIATLEHLAADVEVVVFSDANGMYEPESIEQLVAPFSDPTVGAVAGELRYAEQSAEGIYRRYENALKRNESKLIGCLTAEGSIFAARRGLIPRLRADEIEDMAIPLAIALGGHRVVYQPAAVSVERFGLGHRGQYERRRRIVSRALRTTWRYREILNPARCGALSLMFLSHRILRWFSPFAVLLLGVGFAGIVVSQLPERAVPAVIVLLALVGVGVPYLLRDHGRAGVLWASVVALAAITAGVAAALRGHTVVTWAPARIESSDP